MSRMLQILCLAVWLPATAVTAACHGDEPGPIPPAVPPAPGRLVATVICTVNVDEKRTACTAEPASARDPGAAGRAVQPSPDAVIVLASNEAYTAADSTYSADVTLRNPRALAIGTRDGTTVHGVTAVMDRGPTAAAYRAGGTTPPEAAKADTGGAAGGVRVRSPDGHHTFTRVNQPYFHYREVIGAHAWSRARRWRWTVPPNVAAFTYRIRVFAAMPGESRVPATAPDTVPRAIYRTGRYVTGSSWISGTFLRDVVVVGFRKGATAEERETAVELVSGTVVGGRNSGTGEGEYFVQIPDTGSEAGLAAAIAELSALPQVEFAVAEIVDAFGP